MAHLKPVRRLSRAEIERLVLAYRPLAYRLARNFRSSGIRFEDLAQEAMLGLVVAAQKFDPRRGVRFATYAHYWIRAHLLAHLQRFRGPIALGKRRRDQQLFFGIPRMRQRLEREGAVDRAMLARALRATEADVAAMQVRLGRADVSVDEPSPRGAAVLAQLVDLSPSPEERVAAAEVSALLERDLPRLLDARERMILQARYLADSPATLEILGRRLHISRERVRQIELRAKNKLRDRWSERNPGGAFRIRTGE